MATNWHLTEHLETPVFKDVKTRSVQWPRKKESHTLRHKRDFDTTLLLLEQIMAENFPLEG